jgi:catechol 2,3-dioxygenase-like lactoylglutathione lyase family enzyme
MMIEGAYSMTSRIPAERIIHTIHGVRDMNAARMQYQDVLGGLVFSEGYEPNADRDMALLYVTDHMIEPMAPRNATDITKSFAKWLDRYGEGWHSFEIKVPDAAAAAVKLEEAGIRLLKSPYPVFFFIHGASTGGLLIEVCEVPMRGDPHDLRNWNPGWAEGMTNGLLRLDHIACVLPDIAQTLHVLTEIFDGEMLSDERVSAPQAGRRVLIKLGNAQIALIQPDDKGAGPLGTFIGKNGGGIYALVWSVEDEARARSDFALKKLGIDTAACVGGAFAIDPADFRGARHEFKGMPIHV